MRNIFDEVKDIKLPFDGMELKMTVEQASAEPEREFDGTVTPAHIKVTFLSADPQYKGVTAAKKFHINHEEGKKQAEAILKLKELDDICGGHLQRLAGEKKEIFDTRVLTKALVGNGKNAVICGIGIYGGREFVRYFFSIEEEEAHVEAQAEREAIQSESDDFLDDEDLF